MEYIRWKRLMYAFGIEHNEETYNALVKAYLEKHRYYHTSEHIKAVLNHLDSVTSLCHCNHEIELALWFHDAVYKPFSATNEYDSATWADEFLSQNNVEKDVILRVRKLIMATLHTSQCKSSDEKLMVDIDLTILGVCENLYQKFEQDIRLEYKQVPFFIFKKKRKEILQDFLKRERIYQNDFFYDKFEAQARVNLKNAIKELSN